MITDLAPFCPLGGPSEIVRYLGENQKTFIVTLGMTVFVPLGAIKAFPHLLFGKRIFYFPSLWLQAGFLRLALSRGGKQEVAREFPGGHIAQRGSVLYAFPLPF